MVIEIFFGDKKGISPLIATVLLIAFAVALGAVVMSWGNQVYEDSQNLSIICEKSELGVFTFANGINDVCIDQDNLLMTIEVIKGEIIDFKIVVVGSKQILSVNEVIEYSLTDGDLEKIIIPYDKYFYGDINEVRVMPIVGGIDNSQICSENYLTISTIPNCE